MFVGILIFAFFNYHEPQIDTQLDFFELMFILSQYAAGVFGVIVGIKYRGSKVFGKAYLALGIGYLCAGSATTVFKIYEIVLQVANPFPSLADVFLFPFYILVLYHLVTCVRYFKKKLSRRDKLILILMPLILTTVFIAVNMYPFYVPGSIPDLLTNYIQVGDATFKLVEKPLISGEFQHIVVNDVIYQLVPIELTTTKYEQVPLGDGSFSLVPIIFTNFHSSEPYEGDIEYWVGFGLILFYFVMITINLAFAIIGTEVFRGTVLGSAWGLLLIGIIITSFGDIYFFFNAIFSYDRTVDVNFWVFGFMIISYALYIHKKRL